jgi:crotonobetainyl-CoA:carnitine CoA-transferase CaiB-like acyl-CoA transferase
MLSQYKVLDVTGRRGAMAGYLLAMHGAQVTRVVTDADPDDDGPYLTSTGGVGRAAVDASFGRGKQTLVLDGDRARQRERLRELIAEADVLLESWTPGERADWGLDPATTAALAPRLVHASLTPFGIDGPKAAWAATDLTIMASASPLAVTGDRDRAPVRMSIPQAHSFAGAAAAGAVLLALF